MKRFPKVTMWSAVALLLAFGGGFVFHTLLQGQPQVGRDQSARYPLLAKQIFTDNSNDILINFVPLRKKLQARFDAVNAKKSFYFEYLPDGTSIRIGADQDLTAASLIKVPLVMNLYKAAELHRIDLDKTVTVTTEELDNAYGDLWTKGAGYQLTLRRAAELTLQESDNTAAHVIFDHVRGLLNDDEQSLAQLDVDQNLQDGQAVINARAYSSVLKGLYFSSYLQKADSQEMLDRLTRSAETRRLTKELPGTVKVAHKNGIFNASWTESDCGIVYLPKRPYALCVMVGLPEDQANKLIAEVSKDVYDFVTQQ